MFSYKPKTFLLKHLSYKIDESYETIYYIGILQLFTFHFRYPLWSIDWCKKWYFCGQRCFVVKIHNILVGRIVFILIPKAILRILHILVCVWNFFWIITILLFSFDTSIKGNIIFWMWQQAPPSDIDILLPQG